MGWQVGGSGQGLAVIHPEQKEGRRGRPLPPPLSSSKGGGGRGGVN